MEPSEKQVLKVMDMNGFQIEVTDLDKAIEMAEFFKDCTNIPPIPADKERQVYWQDMYEKLTALQSKKTEQHEQPRR